jgi:3',5'-cyclic AMP phosphodiesterase CpdA
LKFIQISDTHLIGDECHSLYGLDPKSRLIKALQSIDKWHKDAKFIAITGDLTNDGSSSAYKNLQEIISNSNFPIYPILGNHDKRDSFCQYFQGFKNSNFIQYAKEIDGKVFLFLDTLVENQPYGLFCQNRLDWIESQLQAYKDKKIYIFMHHHPIPSGLYDMDTMANFKSSEIFWNMLKKYKNIKHIAFGHLHRIMHSCKDGISLHSTRSTAFEVAYRTDCKEEYLTNAENPTYAIIDINKDGDTRVHHHEYLSEDKIYIGEC